MLMNTAKKPPQRTPLDPNVDPSLAPGQAPLGPPPNPTPVPGVPQPAQPGAPPTPTPVPGVPESSPKAAPIHGSDTGGGSVPLPQQLPDGQGGAIAVPPANIDPSLPTQQFSGESNLINTQVNPTADPRTMKLQGMQDQTLDKLINGPDRNAMAKSQYDTWQADTNPDFEHSIADATDAAAAHGQIRSGQLTNRYGDLAQRRVLDQTTARNRYMQQALSDSIGDTRAAFGAASDAAAGAESEGRANRNELRGERGYQSSQAEQALINRMRQWQAEQAAEGQDFGQGLDLYGAGNQGDPTGAFQDAAASAGSDAATSGADLAALLRMLGQRRGQAAA